MKKSAFIPLKWQFVAISSLIFLIIVGTLTTLTIYFANPKENVTITLLLNVGVASFTAVLYLFFHEEDLSKIKNSLCFTLWLQSTTLLFFSLLVIWGLYLTNSKQNLFNDLYPFAVLMSVGIIFLVLSEMLKRNKEKFINQIKAIISSSFSKEQVEQRIVKEAFYDKPVVVYWGASSSTISSANGIKVKLFLKTGSGKNTIIG